ncbi:MAG: LacI family transcriptional regulator [Lachnospiraceae bacterium]|nr:LacI family transcriptional regulator [Lachnospiraceae bacterium]
MNKNLTISDIADALGVSKTTVSRAISGKGRIGKETTRRVLDYIKENNYTPNLYAKGLAEQKTYNICVVVPGSFELVDWNFFHTCLLGIQEVAEFKGYDILMTTCNRDDISSLERVITNKKVDGVILLRSFLKDKEIEYMKSTGTPFITTGSSEYEKVYQVDHDHRKACKELMLGIMESGLKKFAFFGEDQGDFISKNRIQGLNDALSKYNYDIADNFYLLESKDLNVLEKNLKMIVESGIECIVCMDDNEAVRVIRQMDRMMSEGFRCLSDVKIASFYDSRIIDESYKKVSSIFFDARELGHAACELLLQLMDGENIDYRTVLPYEMHLQL